MSLNALRLTEGMPPEDAYQLGWSDAETAARSESAGETAVWVAKLERVFTRLYTDSGLERQAEFEKEVEHTMRLAAHRDKSTGDRRKAIVEEVRLERERETTGPREPWPVSRFTIPCDECSQLGETRHTVNDQHVCLICIAFYPEKAREWAPMPPAEERHRMLRGRGRGRKKERRDEALFYVDEEGSVQQGSNDTGLVCKPLAGRQGVTTEELFESMRSLAGGSDEP